MRVSYDQQREYSLNLVYVTWSLATANRSLVSIHVTEMFGLDKGVVDPVIFSCYPVWSQANLVVVSRATCAHVGDSEIWGCWGPPLMIYRPVILYQCCPIDGCSRNAWVVLWWVSSRKMPEQTKSSLCDNWDDWWLTCSTPHFFAGDNAPYMEYVLTISDSEINK